MRSSLDIGGIAPLCIVPCRTPCQESTCSITESWRQWSWGRWVASHSTWCSGIVLCQIYHRCRDIRCWYNTLTLWLNLLQWHWCFFLAAAQLRGNAVLSELLRNLRNSHKMGFMEKSTVHFTVFLAEITHGIVAFSAVIVMLGIFLFSPGCVIGCINAQLSLISLKTGGSCSVTGITSNSN